MDTEANQQQQQQKQDRLSRKRWTPFQDKVLADLVIKQIQSGTGNRQNDVFDRKAWNSIREEFHNQTGLNYNNTQLRKHLEVLRVRYNSLKSSRVENEFVIGGEDTLGFDLWEDLGVQPRNESSKVKECHIYEQLCTIFEDDSSRGKYAQSSHFEGVEEPENLPTPNVVQENTNWVTRKRKRVPDSHPIQVGPASLETMAGALFDMVSVLRSRKGNLGREGDRFSITKCISVLDEFENVDESVYFAALDLFEDPGIRETFLSLKDNKIRLTWLQGKCRNILLQLHS